MCFLVRTVSFWEGIRSFWCLKGTGFKLIYWLRFIHHCFLGDDDDDCHPSLVAILEGDTKKPKLREQKELLGILEGFPS